ncbi:MAG: glycosyltransferase family 2 protein [Candidatus Ozemobacteraceae bacterium]
MKCHTLTVVTPNYNHGQYLSQAIEAVASQSRPPDEFIILDDGSTDNSVEIIEEYARKFSFIRVMKNKTNGGAAKAINKLFQEVKGDYLFVTCADDFILPGFFEKAMEMADRFPQAGLVFGNFVALHTDGREALVEVRGWNQPDYFSPGRFLTEYLETHPASHSLCGSTIYRRTAFEEVGRFRPELGSWGDTFAARAIALRWGACYIPQKCMVWRLLQTSLSHSTGRDIHRMLDIISRGIFLMRSPEFRPWFPETHVSSFEKRFREFAVENYFYSFIPGRNPIRKVIRKLMVRTFGKKFFRYKGDISCYQKKSTSC